MSCVFCNLVKAPQNNSTFITEFEHSAAFLNFDQEFYPGQSLLILKEHHDHLHLTPVSLQQAIVPEMIKLTTGILKAFGGMRANHQSLGNQVSHVHWHITPRYLDDKMAGGPPLARKDAPRLTENIYREMAARIRDAL